MYIEFRLPMGSGGQAASYALSLINEQLITWASKYNVKYQTKIFKYTYRVTFDSDETYSLFGLTWVPSPKHPNWTSYRLITDLNHKI